MKIAAAPVRKHKTRGIASFVLALVAMCLFLLSVALEIYLESTRGTTQIGNLLEIGDLLLICLDIVAIGLAISGLLDKTSKKLFPTMGLCTALVPLLVTAGVVAVLFAGKPVTVIAPVTSPVP